jgi:poly-gamma-glutamate synthesis protein (capsule biosynthesis protein)
LEQTGIASVGAGENITAARSPVIFDIGGLRLAILSYVDVPVEFRGFDTRSWIASDTKPGVAWADRAWMDADINAARGAADIVVVLLHSGYEYVQSPSPPQRLAAEQAIQAGADVVLGHHSHVLQPMDILGRQLIAYGLGNFAFPDGGETESMLLQLWIDAEGLREIELIPIVISDDGHPTIPEQPIRDELWRGIVELVSMSP